MLGIGIDLVENKRIYTSCSSEFIDQILTPKEKLTYLQKKGNKKLEFICGRFAAKEAIIKSVSLYESPHMLEIEIENDDKGIPKVIYKNYTFLLSISHEKRFTVAQAILVKI